MGVRKHTAGANWFWQNFELISRADEIVGAQLGSRSLCRHTNQALCEDVFAVVRASLTGANGAESSSVLLLGEASSGKSHAVDECLRRLRQDQELPSVVLRAHGGAYGTDVECMRHLATQVSRQVRELPDGNASFEQSMEWLRAVLKESFQEASAAVIVLDRFEHFCSRSRQTLLYNLFDVAQEAGVRICIIGMSEKMDVMGLLEKRIKSRFSMRHVHAFRPATFDDLLQILVSKTHLPATCGLKASFVADFNRNVEAALRQRQPQWQPHVDLGRPPSWFLSQCVPVASLLFEFFGASATAEEPATAAKRPRLATPASAMPSAALGEVNRLLLSSLAEVEHIVLIALFRIRDRRLSATLRTTLYEIELLHKNSNLVFAFDPDSYTAAFNRLVQMKLVNTRSPGSMDAGKRYMPCESTIHDAYFDFVCDLEKSENSGRRNPLRALPGEVQQWAARQRKQD